MASLCEFRLCENQQSWTQPSEFELKKRSCLSAYLSSTIASQMPIPPNICRSIVSIVSILLTKAIQVTCALYIKQPYHTSILSGEGSVQELLSGHLKHIQCELGVTKEVFHQLIYELQTMGHTRSKYVSLEEQLATFLYISVTGLMV